jgi:hypothetical protein
MTQASDDDALHPVAGAQATRNYPALPFDPEVLPELEAFDTLPRPFTIDRLAEARASVERKMAEVTDEDLRRGGAYELDEHEVPGPVGDPAVKLLVCTPAIEPERHLGPGRSIPRRRGLGRIPPSSGAPRSRAG